MVKQALLFVKSFSYSGNRFPSTYFSEVIYYFHLYYLYLDYKIKPFFPQLFPRNNDLYNHNALRCIIDISDSEYNHGAVMEKSYTQR